MDWPEQALVSSAKLHGGYVKCAAHNHSSEQLADHSKVTLELVYRGYYILLKTGSLYNAIQGI